MKLLALAVTLAGSVALLGCDKHTSEAGPEGAAGQVPSAIAATPVKVTEEPGMEAGEKTHQASGKGEGASCCGDASSGGESCGGGGGYEEAGGGCNKWDHAADQVARRPVPADADWKTISVTGMTCGGCERRIIANLGSLEGVLAVEADAELGQVRVATAQGQDLRQAAVDRINELGYRAQ
jgi:copper chaperone CopZ